MWRSCAFLGPPKLIGAPNWPIKGVKLTPMDSGEFKYIHYYQILILQKQDVSKSAVESNLELDISESTMNCYYIIFHKFKQLNITNKCINCID